MDVRQAMEILACSTRLSAAQTESLFDQIFQGLADDAQIAAIISMMQVRGVADEELLGAARSMRSHAVSVPMESGGGILLDTCGTGGAPKTFNVSTIAALVVAAAGQGRVKVAKHGNKSRTGRGSAEVLEQLGVRIDAPASVQARCLRDCGVCFCFAVQHHPAARYAAPARRSLGFPTIFNLLGPLCNPAGATHQVMGVYAERFVEPMARTLAALGTTRAVVMHGHGGMDEFSTTGPTVAALVDHGRVTPQRFDAIDLGIPRADPASLVAHDLADGVRIARSVLDGTPGPCLDMVLVSAGLGLWVCEQAPDLARGVAIAREAIASGRARTTLETLARLSHEPA